MNVNRVIVAGNITRAPELKATPNGQNVCSFSIATNRTWTDKQGQKQEQSEFHNCVAWGKTAETISQYMGKGSLILVEGRLQTRSWDGEDGKKNYRTEIVVESVQFGPRRQPSAEQAPPPEEYPDEQIPV